LQPITKTAIITGKINNLFTVKSIVGYALFLVDNFCIADTAAALSSIKRSWYVF